MDRIQTSGDPSLKAAAIYIRVSTTDQQVESQLYDLRELASRRSFEVVKVYQDCGVSGRRARRPGLDAMMADARQHKFAVVLVAAFDRVAMTRSKAFSLCWRWLTVADQIATGQIPRSIARNAALRLSRIGSI